MNKKIVFIHGLGGFSFADRNLIKNLEKRGLDPLVFSYDKKYGNISLENIARDFDDFAMKIASELVLVGISQGGIIGSYWLEFMSGEEKCKDLVSVCSPFYGSSLACFLPLEGIQELRPKSDFLFQLREKIKKSNVRYHCIWNPIDLVVIPGSNAKLDSAYESKSVLAPLHSLTSSGRPVLDLIQEVIWR